MNDDPMIPRSWRAEQRITELEDEVRGLREHRNRLVENLEGMKAFVPGDKYRAVVAERDALAVVVSVVRDAFVRPNDDEWKIDHGALVLLADALDALDAAGGPT